VLNSASSSRSATRVSTPAGWRGRTRSFQTLQLVYGRRAGTAAALVNAGGLPAARYLVTVILAAYALALLAEVTQTARELARSEAAPAACSSSWTIPRPSSTGRRTAPSGPRHWGVAFRVGPGGRVGHSGAGKSTCANLLLRFWDPDAGRVTLGGVDLRDWPANDVRAHVALVPRDVYLFNRSVRDNIRLGLPNATETDVEAAARQALAHDLSSLSCHRAMTPSAASAARSSPAASANASRSLAHCSPTPRSRHGRGRQQTSTPRTSRRSKQPWTTPPPAAPPCLSSTARPPSAPPTTHRARPQPRRRDRHPRRPRLRRRGVRGAHRQPNRRPRRHVARARQPNSCLMALRYKNSPSQSMDSIQPYEVVTLFPSKPGVLPRHRLGAGQIGDVRLLTARLPTTCPGAGEGP